MLRAPKMFDVMKGRVVTNCMVLTEGYDEPSVAGIILARPTKSSLLYTQMIGRGTRLHPGKENVTIVDIVDVTRDHSLAGLPTLFGLTDRFDLEGRTTTEVERALEWVAENRPWVRTDLATSLTDLRHRCTRVNLLELGLPDELCGVAEFAWTATGPAAYRLGLAERESVTVTPTIMGRWEIALVKRSEREDLGPSTVKERASQQAEWIRGPDGFANQAFVARTQDGELVGHGWVARVLNQFTGRSEALVLNLFIEEDFRNRGAAKHLLRVVEEWARGQDLERIGLHVGVDNEPAVRLFEAMDYTPESQRMTRRL